MRKLIVIWGICMVMFVSCSTFERPTGDAEKDAKQFAAELFSACKSDDIDKMAEILNVYGDFYNDQDTEDIKLFLKTWKYENDIHNYSKYGIDEDRFYYMATKADKEGKMDKLFKEYYLNSAGSSDPHISKDSNKNKSRIVRAFRRLFME